VPDLTGAQREQMFELLDAYYLHASPEQFEKDLREKQWVLLATDPETHRVRGFSTLMRLRARVRGAPISAFFSGDTVFEADCWGRGDTSRALGHLLAHMVRRADSEPDERWYWFMISSTYRSYRLLPMLFAEFHRSPNRAMPATTARVLGHLVREKFGTEYDPATSVIRFANPTVFRSQDPTARPDRCDPWERFFLEANPGHENGDRLASLAELRVDNLTPLARRLIQRAGASATPPDPGSARAPAGTRTGRHVA
jgi:hypothetical protein